MTDDIPANIDNVTVHLPLYDAFYALHDEIIHRYPSSNGRSHGIDALGIQFFPPGKFAHGEYWCTPLNTLSFAWTGGGGEHYSFLVIDNRIDEHSPVVLTAPSSSRLNIIIAPDFRTFLRVGLSRAFFGLSQFAYNRRKALLAYGSDQWSPSDSSDVSAGYVPDDRCQAVMDFVIQQLDLEPYFYSENEFTSIQSAVDSLQMSDEYRDMYGD